MLSVMGPRKFQALGIFPEGVFLSITFPIEGVGRSVLLLLSEILSKLVTECHKAGQIATFGEVQIVALVMERTGSKRGFVIASRR